MIETSKEGYLLCVICQSPYSYSYGQLSMRGKTLETASENRALEVVTEYMDLNPQYTELLEVVTEYTEAAIH